MNVRRQKGDRVVTKAKYDLFSIVVVAVVTSMTVLYFPSPATLIQYPDVCYPHRR